MTGKTHMTVGVSAMVAMCALYPNGVNILGMTVLPTIGATTSAIGSYAPDVDIQQSKLGQKYRFISKHLKHRGFTHTLVVPIILLALMLSVARIPSDIMLYINIIIGILCAVNTLHMVYIVTRYGKIDVYDLIQGCSTAYACTMLIQNINDTSVLCSMIFGFFFGWLMHIVADAFNEKGIPPLPGAPHVHIMCVDTGTWMEYVWLAVYMAVVIFVTVKGIYL